LEALPAKGERGSKPLFIPLFAQYVAPEIHPLREFELRSNGRIVNGPRRIEAI
jgi:hypothetical protein